jgi:hypothetical protein
MLFGLIVFWGSWVSGGTVNGEVAATHDYKKETRE